MLIFPCSYPTPGIVNAKTGEVIVADCYDNVRLPSLTRSICRCPPHLSCRPPAAKKLS